MGRRRYLFHRELCGPVKADQLRVPRLDQVFAQHVNPVQRKAGDHLGADAGIAGLQDAVRQMKHCPTYQENEGEHK